MFVQKQNPTLQDQYPDAKTEMKAAIDTQIQHQVTSSPETELEDTLMFAVATSDSKLLFQKIKVAETDLMKKLKEIELMKAEFNRDVRPLLLSSCLIMETSLDSDLAAFLHFLTHAIVKHTPIYLTALDVMRQQRTKSKQAFRDFVSYIISERIMIDEVWDRSYGDIETRNYDFAPDGLDFYRGESDARFTGDSDKTKDGVAKLSFMIWKDRQVVWAEVIDNVICRSINEAEVLAAIALQLKCLDLGFIKKLKHFTDSVHVVDVISGKHTIEDNDPKRSKNMRGKYTLLRHLKDKFESLIVMKNPRQLMFMADALLRFESVPTHPDVSNILVKFGDQLRGAPVYTVHQNKRAQTKINKFEETASEYKNLYKPATVFYLPVERNKKFDALLELIDTLCPVDLRIIIDKVEKKPTELVQKIRNLVPNDLTPFKDGTCSVFWSKITPMLNGSTALDKKSEAGGDKKSEDGCEIMTGDITGHQTMKETGQMKKKKLVIVFDANLAKSKLYEEETCTIILAEPQEACLLKSNGVGEVNTGTYVYFHGVEYDDVKARGRGRVNTGRKQKSGNT